MICLLPNFRLRARFFKLNMHTKPWKIAGILLCFVLISRTAVALKGKDGVVFAVENIVLSKLYEPGCVKRTFSIDEHIGMVCSNIYLHTISGCCRPSVGYKSPCWDRKRWMHKLQGELWITYSCQGIRTLVTSSCSHFVNVFRCTCMHTHFTAPLDLLVYPFFLGHMKKTVLTSTSLNLPECTT